MLFYKRLAFPFFFWILLIHPAICQNPNRFQNEIDRFKADTTNYSSVKDLVLFTGSSSIRIWTDVKKDFPDLHVLNTGFGGSHMSDLLYYADTLILCYRPVLIFIYEGDNDIGDGNPRKDIFLEDGLHMNRKGYDIWKDMVGKFLQSHRFRGKA